MRPRRGGTCGFAKEKSLSFLALCSESTGRSNLAALGSAAMLASMQEEVRVMLRRLGYVEETGCVTESIYSRR